MKRWIIIAAFAGMATFIGVAATAQLYPVAPPGTFVSLTPGDFIQSVPDQSPWLPIPNPVIGDDLGQHPGIFLPVDRIAFPTDSYFVGVFGGPIDTNDPNTAVYLWETTHPPNDVAFAGPQIQVGYWDGALFIPYGVPQTASYLGTGVPATDPFREITSSITPLSAFGIAPGFPFQLNAVRIEGVDPFAHNQVTAVAVNAIPEPSTMLLFSTGLACLLGYGWLRKKQ